MSFQKRAPFRGPSCEGSLTLRRFEMRGRITRKYLRLNGSTALLDVLQSIAVILVLRQRHVIPGGVAEGSDFHQRVVGRMLADEVRRRIGRVSKGTDGCRVRGAVKRRQVKPACTIEDAENFVNHSLYLVFDLSLAWATLSRATKRSGVLLLL